MKFSVCSAFFYFKKDKNTTQMKKIKQNKNRIFSQFKKVQWMTERITIGLLKLLVVLSSYKPSEWTLGNVMVIKRD